LFRYSTAGRCGALLIADEIYIGAKLHGRQTSSFAIGSAIFAASGARLRHLPIRPKAVR